MTSMLPPSASDPATRQRASERVAGILSDRIRSGVHQAGDLLPTERVLAADLRVHRRSVRAAIEHLVREGLVSHRPNCRPTVAARSRPPDAPPPEDAGTSSGSTAAGPLPARSRISASNLIALIMWHGGGPLEHAGTSQQRIFWGMNQTLMQAGYHAVFLDIGGEILSEESNAAREAAHLRYLRDQNFGGALFYPYAYRHNHALVREVSRAVPLVLLDRKLPDVAVDFVGLQNFAAQREATRHLIAQGHRRIAYVTRSEPIQSVQERVEGYLEAMRGEEPGLTQMILTIPMHWDARDWTVADAVFQLPADRRPTAAVCFTDYMAVSLAERLEHLGLSVPEDVALTGFDDIVPALPNGVGLTTLAQPYEEIGTTAVDLLLRRIKDPLTPPRSVELPARLVTRASSLAPSPQEAESIAHFGAIF